MTIRVSVILFRGASGSKKLRPLIDSLAHSTEGGVVRFIGTIEGDRTRRPVGKVSECEIVTRRLPRSGRHRVHRSDFGEPWKLIAMDDNPYKSPEKAGSPVSSGANGRPLRIAINVVMAIFGVLSACYAVFFAYIAIAVQLPRAGVMGLGSGLLALALLYGASRD